MDPEIQRIIALLQQTFEGGAWHGPSVREALKDVRPNEVHRRLPDTHSITELVNHMVAWRTYVIKKLSGDAAYKVSDEMNFPSTDDWTASLSSLEQSQQDLLSALKASSDRKLPEQVPGSSQPLTFYTLIHGIIHHDLYHAAQIILIRKATAQQSI